MNPHNNLSAYPKQTEIYLEQGYLALLKHEMTSLDEEVPQSDLVS
jgi:hypothetical protein